MSKKVLKMVHTQMEPMGWEIFSPPSLSLSILPSLPSLILYGRFVNFKIELFIIRRVVRDLLFSSGCRGSVHRSDKTPSANYINTVCECRS